MAELIKRDDVLGLLEDMLMDGEYGIIASAYSQADEKKAYQAIRDIPAVNRLIPCSERLPEKSGLYLTYQKELGRFQLMRYSPVPLQRNGTGWFDDNYGLYVTHWMPLPEPPEKE